MKPFSAALLFLTALLLAGCSGMKNMFRVQVDGLFQDPGFTYQAVISGKMAVGGVVSPGDSVDDGARPRRAGLLLNSIRDKRDAFTLIPAASVIEALTFEEYSFMLSDYASAGGLGEQRLAGLSDKAGARYFVMAGIQSDVVEKSREETPEKKIVSKIGRRVTVTFNIYDLEKKAPAWSGTITQKEEKQSEYEKKADDGLIIAVVKAVADAQETEDQKYPYPEVPGSDQVLSKVFKGFAAHMPEKK